MIDLVWFIVTIALYIGAVELYERSDGKLWLHPILLPTVIIIVALKLLHVPFAIYLESVRPFEYFLELAVVALALPIVRHLAVVRDNVSAVVAAIVAGSVTGVGCAVIVGIVIGAPDAMLATVAVKSITTPLAVTTTNAIGGHMSIAAAIVVLSGIVTAVAGPPILRRMAFTDSVGIGVVLGTAGHAIATAEAFRKSEVIGAASGFAMASNGLLTALILPLIWPYFT
ncbi:LrgB family protein [Kordiimonas aquimaris]|uniref:LrgB family protein n=1 Tax=Kordiimonas aquimaris TaxID=707591 RepID=UPI0021CF1336|nr:LrgB family protein [Kordiimonas aquimaris]